MQTINAPRDYVSNQLYWNTYYDPQPGRRRRRRSLTPPKSMRRLVFNSPENKISNEEFSPVLDPAIDKRKIREIPRRLKKTRWETLKD